MPRNLRAVEPGERPAPSAPKTLAEATERDRRSFLVRARLEIAKTIDAGVPAHALGRLIAEMERLDSEIRRVDAVDEEESGRNVVVEDGKFDAAAI